MPAPAALTITRNPAASRFEAVVDGQLAVCDYRRQGNLIDMTHTGVPRALEGRGIAAALVAATLDWARAQGLRVRPSCSYVAVYMLRHPDTLDLRE
ncbi:MAG: GNAT family N-acetyltransferase [Rubrivivax sp.]|nr:GNAT family N-acetyltransferase [Rubrivivax sp.]MDP3082087.1 GNAT family N-acetyltransferase [Rubrivivax sp.]